MSRLQAEREAVSGGRSLLVAGIRAEGRACACGDDAHQLDAVVVTSEANVEYYSGFEIQFAWNTPSPPWYFIIPRTAAPVAIIPEIGETNWLATFWCDRS